MNKTYLFLTNDLVSINGVVGILDKSITISNSDIIVLQIGNKFTIGQRLYYQPFLKKYYKQRRKKAFFVGHVFSMPDEDGYVKVKLCQ